MHPTGGSQDTLSRQHLCNSVAGSGPGTSLGPEKRPGLTILGPDQDHKNIGPVLGPGPGPPVSGWLERTAEDRSGPVLTWPGRLSGGRS